MKTKACGCAAESKREKDSSQARLTNSNDLLELYELIYGNETVIGQRAKKLGFPSNILAKLLAFSLFSTMYMHLLHNHLTTACYCHALLIKI